MPLSKRLLELLSVARTWTILDDIEELCLTHDLVVNAIETEFRDDPALAALVLLPIARLLDSAGQVLLAEEGFRKALELQELAFGEHHPGSLYAIDWLRYFTELGMGTMDRDALDLKKQAIARRPAHEYRLADAEYLEQLDRLLSIVCGSDGKRSMLQSQAASIRVGCYTITAAQGDLEAQRRLGMYYRPSRFSVIELKERGESDPTDLKKAADYYRQAAMQSDCYSQYCFAEMVLHGDGVPADVVQSYAWFSIACEGGDAAAKQQVSALEERMTTEALDAARRLIPTLKASLKAVPPGAFQLAKSRYALW